MIPFLKKYFEQILFIVSLSFIMFCCGTLLGYYKIFPSSLIVSTISIPQNFAGWNKEFQHSLCIKPSMVLEKTDQKKGGVVKILPEKTEEGVYLITSMAEKYFGIKLIDIEGNVLHKWDVPYSKMWPKANHLKTQPRDWDVEIDHAFLYPNGDVLFCYQRKGIVKVDKDSNIIWKKPYKIHHLLYEDKDSNIWAPSEKDTATEYQFSNKRLIVYNPETIVKLSPDGKILEEIDIIDSIIQSGYKGLFSISNSHIESLKSPITIKGEDYTHLNDVDIVENPELFNSPLFKKGDIIASLRNINSIILIDAETKKVKWAVSLPFMHQHDPDITQTGKISVFDNQGGGNNEIYEHKSRILTIDPTNNEVNTVYEKAEDNAFFSHNRGNHQYLPNGNILIVESCKGHLFEINKEGEIVWEYFDKWDNDHVSIIYHSLKYPVHYAEFTKEKQHNDQPK